METGGRINERSLKVKMVLPEEGGPMKRKIRGRYSETIVIIILIIKLIVIVIKNSKYLKRRKIILKVKANSVFFVHAFFSMFSAWISSLQLISFRNLFSKKSERHKTINQLRAMWSE